MKHSILIFLVTTLLLIISFNVQSWAFTNMGDDYYPIDSKILDYEEHDLPQGFKYLLSERWGSQISANGLTLDTREALRDDDVVSRIYYEKNSDGLYQHGYDWIQFGKAERKMSAAKYTTLLFPLKDGSKWTSTVNSVVTTCNVFETGKEVDVPAGIFKNCIGVYCEDPKRKTYVWYAPNVGKVKVVTEFGDTKKSISLIKIKNPEQIAKEETREEVGILGWLLGSKDTLSNSETEKIIRDHFKLPKVHRKRISITQNQYQNFLSGVFFKQDKYQCGMANLDVCRDATEVGKMYFDGLTENPYDVNTPDRFGVVGAIYKRDIKNIDEVLIDEESKIALVTYIEADFPIWRTHSIVCPNNNVSRSYCRNGISEETKKIKVKKYDKGWRVME